jgi:RecA/RadA recombinase
MSPRDSLSSLLTSVRKITDSNNFEESCYGVIKNFISTGDYGLNRIITGSTKKGIPSGKTIIIAGESQSGKSYVAANIAANALNIEQYNYIFYFDSEGGALKDFFKGCGCDLTKIEHVLVENIEDATVKILGTYANILEHKKTHPEDKFLCILDSLGALVASKIMSDASEKGKSVMDLGQKQKLTNNFMKALTIPALKSDTSIVITNHIYDDPSAMYPSKIKNQNGGRGAQYMARIVIQCSKTFEKTEDSKENQNNVYSATILKFMTTKNCLIKAFYESEMYLSFAKGPHKYFGLLQPALQYGLIQKPKQGCYVVPSYDPNKTFKLKQLLSCAKAFEAIIPQLDEKSIAEMSYGGSAPDEDLDILNNEEEGE